MNACSLCYVCYVCMYVCMHLTGVLKGLAALAVAAVPDQVTVFRGSARGRHLSCMYVCMYVCK